MARPERDIPGPDWFQRIFWLAVHGLTWTALVLSIVAIVGSLL